MDIRTVLKSMGLTPNDISVYTTLLRLGMSTAGRIAKEAHTNRTCTYDALKRLLERGLVSYVVQANRKWFKAVNPKRLLELLEEQRKDVQGVLPQLEGLYNQTKSEENVTLYKGLKGIKSVLQDIIRTGKDNCVFGNEGQLQERMPYFHPHFIRQLNESGIKTRQIVRKGRKGEISKQSRTRYVPKEVKSPVTTNIYGNKIAIIIWTATPEAVIIENKAAADSYRAYFEVMWAAAKAD